jgi:hypothetical protein
LGVGLSATWALGVCGVAAYEYFLAPPADNIWFVAYVPGSAPDPKYPNIVWDVPTLNVRVLAIALFGTLGAIWGLAAAVGLAGSWVRAGFTGETVPLQGELGSGLPSEIKGLRLFVTVGALGLALAHLIWPTRAVDLITLVLFVVAILPWVAPLFKSLEFPGGWKIEFQELQKAAQRAEQAGLLSPAAEPPAAADYTFQRVAEQDPNLALAGLRIEIEKRLVALAEKRGVEARSRGIGQLLRVLSDRGALGQQERSVLADLTGLLNSAVHGASVDRRATEWAIEIGPRLLRALDDLVAEAA